MSSESVDSKVIQKIKKARRGSLFFADDFLRFGNSKAVTKALERLVIKGELNRVARGIYARLEIHPQFGPVPPTLEELAKAIAKRDKAKISPTGVLALHQLGLSTQVPLNAVYLTNGSARKIKLGKRNLVLKKTAPKNLAAIGEKSGLVIQALKEIGAEKVDNTLEKKIISILKKEKKYHLEHDLVLAPEWIRKIMRRAMR
jgi:hypothetical protein